MAIYEKNNNVFFPEDYIVDIEDDDTYYLMESEALQTLSDFFGIDFKDMDEAMILVRENNDKDDGRIWVNKYQLVDWNLKELSIFVSVLEPAMTSVPSREIILLSFKRRTQIALR